MIDPPWPTRCARQRARRKATRALRLDAVRGSRRCRSGSSPRPNCIVFLWCTWPLLLLRRRRQAALHQRRRVLLAGRRLPQGVGLPLRHRRRLAQEDEARRDRVRARLPRAQRLRAVPARRQRHAEQLEVAPQPDRGLGARALGQAGGGLRLVRELHAGARRVELFSRTSRPGWDTWGYEAGKFDATVTLRARP
jgi:hypothetical protein